MQIVSALKTDAIEGDLGFKLEVLGFGFQARGLGLGIVGPEADGKLPTPCTPNPINPKMPPSSELHKIQGFCSMPGMGHVFRAGEPGREESSIRVLAFA